MNFLINDSKLSKTEKIEVGISYFLQLTMIVAMVYAVYKQEWLNVFAIIGILILTILPAMLRSGYSDRIPVELDLIVIAFIYAAVFLGGYQAFYLKFWWWDGLMHTIGGALLGIAGFLLVYVLNANEKVHLNLEPFFVALFSFSFANVMSVIWEIFEFTVDSFFFIGMQESGLVDTMWDFIVAELGALVVAVLAYFYLKKQRPLVEKLIHKFMHRKWLRRKKNRR